MAGCTDAGVTEQGEATIELAVATPKAWLNCVLDDFPAFLSDHASNEKKASGMALNIASHYPDRPRLLAAMADLAVEELRHYRDVIALMLERGLRPASDRKDRYVNALIGEIRRGTELFLLDRLLVAAIVERRGHERFEMLAVGLQDSRLKRFYGNIAASEERHWRLFVDLANDAADPAAVQLRLQTLIAREAEIISQQELRPALH